MHVERFSHELCTFRNLLRRNGFSVAEIRRVLQRYPFHAEEGYLDGSQSTRSREKLLMPFKIECCSDVEEPRMTDCLNRFRHLLDRDFGDRVKFVSCYTTAKNLIRERYKRFL